MEDVDTLTVRSTKLFLSWHVCRRVCLLKACLLCHKLGHRKPNSEQYDIQQDISPEYVPKCTGQVGNSFVTIKINFHILRLLSEDAPVLNVEWIEDYLQVLWDIEDVIYDMGFFHEMSIRDLEVLWLDLVTIGLPSFRNAT